MKYFNKQSLLIFLILFSVLFITGCNNPFQKDAIVIGPKKEDTKEQESNTNSLDNTEKDKENEISEISNDNIAEIPNENQEVVIDNENFHSEDEVISYFSDIEDETNALLSSDDSSSFKDKITNSFVTVIDFIFYDKEIKGVKFKSLTNEVKSKILDIASRMDNSIENKFPNYKDKIKSTSKKAYTKISEKISQAKEYLSDKTEETIGEENYNNLQENYENLKETVKNTGKKISEGASNIKNKIKNWYEEKTGK